jgi:hypothetical protein
MVAFNSAKGFEIVKKKDSIPQRLIKDYGLSLLRQESNRNSGFTVLATSADIRHGHAPRNRCLPVWNVAPNVEK